MKKILLAACFVMPITTFAAPACPEVAALYQPVMEAVKLQQPGAEPRTVMVPKLGAAPVPLHSAILALELFGAPQATSLPPNEGVFEAMGPTPRLDNTYRAAFMRCDLSELWVVSRGGIADTTRWYGPYQLAQLMTARGDAAPQSQ